MDPKTRIDNLRLSHGLAPAETQLVCALTTGKTFAEFSAGRGVGANTTKTRINLLLGKTGCIDKWTLRLLAAT